MPAHNMTPGTKFMLNSDTPAIYLGPGGMRDIQTVELRAGDRRMGTVDQIVFVPTENEIVAWWYKTEWHLATVASLCKEYPNWTLGWTPAAEMAVSERRKYID